MLWRGADLGGDMVVARRAPADQIGDPLYNLVVVVDDAAMAISHVIRGEDHIANTAKQLLLYEALSLPVPAFAHAPLILNPEGRKLSKRDGVTSINDFRAMGYTPEALANYMTLLGWSVPEGMNEIFTLEAAAKVFDFDRVNKPGKIRLGQTQLAQWSSTACSATRAVAPERDTAVDVKGWSLLRIRAGLSPCVNCWVHRSR